MTKLRTDTLTIRLEPELRRRVEEVRLAMPYKPNLTTMIERGLQLVLAELELMTRESDGRERFRVIQSLANASKREAAE